MWELHPLELPALTAHNIFTARGPGAGSLPLHRFPVPISVHNGQRLIASRDLETLKAAARKKAEELKPPPEPEPEVEQIPEDVIGVASVSREVHGRAQREIGRLMPSC